MQESNHKWESEKKRFINEILFKNENSRNWKIIEKIDINKFIKMKKLAKNKGTFKNEEMPPSPSKTKKWRNIPTKEKFCKNKNILFIIRKHFWKQKNFHK